MRRSWIATAITATALLTFTACAERPLGPAVTTAEDAGATASFARGGNRPANVTVSDAFTADIKTAAGEVVGTLNAVAHLTRIDLDASEQLVGTTRIVGTATMLDGTTSAVDIVDTAPLSINGTSGRGVSALASGPTIQAIGTCEILDLVLGPLHLDLLGLVVDLNQLNLDIVAQAGSGNLLGNLLCAVVGLLDGAAFLTAITQLLEQINAILGAIQI